ncbi:MAG: hypothetical protein AB8F74_19485 [Saprospiraceae bacterium]
MTTKVMITNLENEMYKCSYKTFNGLWSSLLLIVFCFSSQLGIAQDLDRNKKNFISIALLGPGTYYSLNYGRVLLSKSKYRLDATMGVSSFRLRDFTDSFNPDFVLPIGLEFITGGKHQFVVGLGNTTSSLVKISSIDFRKQRSWDQHGYLLLGYRYQKTESPYFFGLAYNPLLERYSVFRNWGIVTIGRFL